MYKYNFFTWNFDLVGVTQSELDWFLLWKVDSLAEGNNLMHILRQPNWIYQENWTVTGALQIEITGLYEQTLSWMMRVLVTQNWALESFYPDFDFFIWGAYRAVDHLWHNPKASVKTTSEKTINVRFAKDDLNWKVFLIIWDTNSVWDYPRLVIEEIISNDIVSWYTPDFSFSRITAYPIAIWSTIRVSWILTKDWILNAPLNSAVSVRLSSASIANWAQILFWTPDFDTQAEWTTWTHRFTRKEAWIYNVSLRLQSTSVPNWNYVYWLIKKNWAWVKQIWGFMWTWSYRMIAWDLNLKLNKGDYIDFLLYNSQSISINLQNNGLYSYLNISKIS